MRLGRDKGDWTEPDPNREPQTFTYDPEGDRIEAQERADRALERGDSPRLWLKPTEPCRECGYWPREVEPGRWVCPCDEWVSAA